MNKKGVRIVVAFGAVVSLAVVGYLVAQRLRPKRVVIGELKVLSYAPQGAEVPISADGITVMFDRAVVPLTTLDSGRSKRIPLKITPSVDGEFFWLGTRGFIFRPEGPLEPATTYRVELPPGIVSIEGYRIEKTLVWEFSTVRPRLLTWKPYDNQTLLPKSASFFLRFNIRMSRADVEKRLLVADAATGQPLLMKKGFVWGDEGHTLRVAFREGLPWDSQIKVTLPPGVTGKKGKLGTLEPVTVTYRTPGKKMVIEKITSFDIPNQEEIVFEPGKEETLSVGSGVCFHFSQEIERKSFEKAFHVETPETRTSKKPQPFFYFYNRQVFGVVGPDGKTEELEGYREGCASFLDDYDRTYTFFLEPQRIVSLSGVPLTAPSEKYLVRSAPAEPFLSSQLTKNILSLQGAMKIPYRVVNLKGLTYRVYRWPASKGFEGYEGVKDETLRESYKPSDPPVSAPLGGGEMVLPLDRTTMTIDQTRLTADATGEIPISVAPNTPTRVLLDLNSLPPSPRSLGRSPGIYLVEVLGTPLLPGQEAPAAVYSMVQLTSVGIALKRELDHLLVWTTDIETGAPLPGLPVKAVFKRWNSSSASYEKTGEQEGVSDPLGVAVLSVSSSYISDDDHVCVEVTQPGRESFSCEEDHRLSDYRSILESAPHFFAFLYTDRPIYRPGQTVFFSSFLREVREGRYFMIPPGTTAAVSVTDASGKKIYSDDKAAIEPGGVVKGSLTLGGDDDTPRGEYTLSVQIGSQRFHRAFLVASYRKPSFKVDLKAATPEIVSGDELKVEVRGSYFFGAPLRRSKATWSIMTTTHLFSPEGYSDFSFLDEDLLRRKATGEGQGEGEGDDDEYFSDYEYDLVATSVSYAESDDQYDDPRRSGSEEGASRGGGGFFKGTEGEKVESIGGRLDDQGLLPIRYRPDLKKYPTSQVLTVEANVEDPSHQEVSGAEEIVVHKADFYLGLKPERWVYGEKESARVKIISLDTAGKPVSRKKFSVDVVRRVWKFIEKRDSRGNWDLIFEPEDTRLATLSGRTDGEGRGEVVYLLPQGGTFRFVAKGKDGRGNEIQAATTVHAWGEGYVPWRLDKPETLELVPDKDFYRVGETAKVLVKSLVPVTKALMTLERGRLLEYKVIDLGGNADHIEIPITEGMIPNLYLSVVAHVGRHGEQPPLLFHGEVEIPVEPEKKRLAVTITPDRTGGGDSPPIYRPGEEVTVRLKTQDPAGKGTKAHVIVSVADESVLRLLNYRLPDLVKKFYYRRPSGVITSSSLLSLKAGDMGPDAAKKRRIFKDTAHFEAHLTTNDGGEASFSFKLPDDLTTWVIEALAVSESKTREAFEAEMKQAAAGRPPGQVVLGSDLLLSDHTLVGGNRGKVMTTLPLVLRTATPRFAAWGDEVRGAIIANNRNPQPVAGRLLLTVSGDAVLKGEKSTDEIPIEIPASSEKSFPVNLLVRSAAGKLTLAAEAQDLQGTTLDSLEVSLPVKDRYAPEVVATSGTTQNGEKEMIDLPKGLADRGGLDISFKASLALAAAPSLRSLVYFPWGCSEQKSATLLALLMAREMTIRFGETYFDTLAPIAPEMAEKAKGLEEKLKLLEDQIVSIIRELLGPFWTYGREGGGIKYWPEGGGPNYLATVQTLWGVTRAIQDGVVRSGNAPEAMRRLIRFELQRKEKGLSADAQAFGLWGLTLDGTAEPELTSEILGRTREMSVAGLSYLLMAIKNGGGGVDPSAVVGRLLSLAKQEPRHTSWPASKFFGGTAVRNTALAAEALLVNDPTDPNIPRALAFLLNRKKSSPCLCTQEALSVSWLLTSYAQLVREEESNFQAALLADGQTLFERSFDKENLLSVERATVPMKELTLLKMPADLEILKKGEGTLYYDLVLKYYLPPEATPTREEGLIVSREYYALDDLKEERPLTEFKVGENYKGHITLVVPQEMNYILIQDLLPAGFEPIDMTLAISSRAAALQAVREVRRDGGDRDRFLGYDDVVTVEDYGTDYGFRHREIRDDAVIWSDEVVPAGVYHIRYPVRATTAGTFLLPGATAFEFYEPEVFGRSRARIITIHEGGS